MKYIAHDIKLGGQLIDRLLFPSRLSAGICALLSLGLVATSLVALLYKSSASQLQVLHFVTDESHASTQTIGKVLDGNILVSNLPLFLFWCLVGIVVYRFAINVYESARHTADLYDEFNNYVNVDRKQLIRITIERLFVRLVVIGAWLTYLIFFFHHLIPYVLVLTLAVSPSSLTLTGVGLAGLAFLILFLGLHVHTVFLRLLMLRARVFE